MAWFYIVTPVIWSRCYIIRSSFHSESCFIFWESDCVCYKVGHMGGWLRRLFIELGKCVGAVLDSPLGLFYCFIKKLIAIFSRSVGIIPFVFVEGDLYFVCPYCTDSDDGIVWLESLTADKVSKWSVSLFRYKELIWDTTSCARWCHVGYFCHMVGGLVVNSSARVDHVICGDDVYTLFDTYEACPVVGIEILYSIDLRGGYVVCFSVCLLC